MNTALSYVIRILVLANVILLFVGGSPSRHNISHPLLSWLTFSSLGLVVLFLISLFFPANKSRKTGKLTDALFTLLAVAMLVFMSLSSLSVI